jgi:hypothetical protein
MIESEVAPSVEAGLRERYERIHKPNGKATVEELLAIADRAAAHVKRPYVDHAELQNLGGTDMLRQGDMYFRLGLSLNL